MPSGDLAEYMALERLDGPSGELRWDQRFALIATVLSNLNRGKKTRPFKLQDFMLYGQRAERWKTARQKGVALSRKIRAMFTGK